MKKYNIFKITEGNFVYIAVMISCCGCEDFLTRNHPTAITDDKFWEDDE